MKTLPVPSLAQTLDRYLEAVSPLLGTEELARTEAAVEAFATGDGPRCQQALLDFAKAEDAAGRSWLWDAWLEAYHVTRVPLPLVSNVGFAIAMPSPGVGLARAADVIHRFAQVHLEHLRGEARPLTSTRGEELCGQQWELIRGGLRDPRPDRDEFVAGSPSPEHREVVVLHHGRAVALPVSDAAGQPLPVATLHAALEGAFAGTSSVDEPVVDQEVAQQADQQVDFTTPGYLDNGSAATVFEQLLADEENAATYARLRDALFVVNLTDEDQPIEQHMQSVAWGRSQAWPFKPLSLQVSLSDDRFVGIHFEHSMADGATVGAIIERAQQLPASTDDTDNATQASATQPLAWRLTDELSAELATGATAYDELAQGLRYRIVRVPAITTRAALPFKVSHDAFQQFILLYAQLATFGRLRSTYESVDMREFQSGRTECLRPNTPAAVELVRAMLDGTATPTELAAALQGHREQVKRCKAGQAIDRHLFGLALMRQRHGYASPLHDDPAYRMLTTDFLSTTSLGTQDFIVRAAFAPTSVGGIGVYYVPVDDELGRDYEISLNTDESTMPAADVDTFARHLAHGAEALQRLVDAAAQTPTQPPSENAAVS